MEDRLSRYNSELAKIKSQHLLRHMEGACDEESDAGQHQHRAAATANAKRRGPSASFEFVIHAPSEPDEDVPPPPGQQPQAPVFVSRLPGFGSGAGAAAAATPTAPSPRRSIASASGQLFELTESEDELLTDFLERQRASDEAATAAAGAASPRVLINGLSLEQFMKKCRSRHLMDSAIERAETFVDDWRGVGAGEQQRSSRRRRNRTAGAVGRRVPLEEPKEEPKDAGDAEAAQKTVELERLERDFKTLLQEAKKARYLRGRNPEILERDRELTTDEIFQSAKSIV